MHVKKVVIKGYKSYSSKVVIESFVKGLNVVVGRNGSGKSNLLSALQMILADDESKKRNRNLILQMNQDAFRGDAAYVEIIFDNQDGFFPEDSPEVSLKRTFGNKKDKFFINGKQIERFDKYLAQVGLVTPYSFVQQGRVNQLATMNDKARLEMMKVVSGETGWNTIAVQIFKLMRDSEILLEGITDSVGRLVALKPELKVQVKQLETYTNASARKSAAEFIIRTRENEKIKVALTKYEEMKSNAAERLNTLKVKSEEWDAKLEKLNFLLVTVLGREEKKAKRDMEADHKKLDLLVLEAGKLENQCSDSHEEMIPHRSERTTNQLKEELARIDAELIKIDPEYQKWDKKEKQLFELSNRQNIQITQYNELMIEVGGSGFKSKNEREKYMATTTRRLQQAQDDAEKNVAVISERIEDIKTSIGDGNRRIADFKQEQDNHKKSVEEIITKSLVLEKQKHAHQSTKQTNWTNLASLEEKLFITREKLEQQHQRMFKAFGSSIMKSYLGMKVVLDKLRQTTNSDLFEYGYYGTVLENIECEEGCEYAIQEAGREKLFYHIVANFGVARKLLAEFNRLKCKSEVRFITLDRVMVGDVNYPKDKDISPLIRHIKFDGTVEKAIRFVFARTLLCNSSEVAVVAAKTHKLNCITHEGDKFSASGVLTGGYRDTSMNMLNFVAERRRLFLQIQSFLDEVTALEASDNKLNTEILAITKSLEKNETMRGKEENSAQKISAEVKVCREKLRNFERRLEAELLNLDRATKSFATAKDSAQFFKQVAEKKTTEIMNGAQINALNEELKGSLMKLKSIRKKLEAVKKTRVTLETRKKQLTAMQDDMSGSQEALPGVKSLILSGAQLKLDLTTKSISEIKLKIQANEESLTAIKEETVKTNAKLQKLAETDIVLKENVVAADLELVKLLEKFFEFQNKYYKNNEFLQSIGAHPSLVPDFSELSTADLYKIVKRENGNLNKNQFINLRAKEQYQEAIDLSKKFKGNLDYFGRTESRISEMLQDIDKNKSGICIDTVRAVQNSFRKIFREMVRSATGVAGYGRFAPYGDGFDFRETNRLEDGKRWWEENDFIGASLRVNFNDDLMNDEQMTDILQLSGGQKSIVALSFLLAIQNANPQSLYVFDEVDQALDPSFREAVAKKMKELAHNAQFICTTFRKEFVEYADSFLGVGFHNQKSYVRRVTREEALEFVQPEHSGSSSNGADESVSISLDNSIDSTG